MPLYFDKRHRRWRFQFDRVVAGVRTRSGKLLPAAWGRAEAEAYDRREEGRLYALATGIREPRPLIAEAIALWLEHRAPQLRDGKNAAGELAKLLPYTEGRFLDELPEVARAFLADAADLAPGTRRNRLAYLKAAVRYAWRRHGLGDRDFTARMEIPAARNERQVYLRPGELARLLRHVPSSEGRALWRIAFYTGLRWVSEILPLTPASVLRTPRGAWLSIADTKTGAPHMVPVHAAIRADLKRLPFARPMREYFDEFASAREKAGMPHVRPHDLRHSLASALISRGATLAEVGRALGHKSALSTRRYAHLYPERLRQIVARIPGISARKSHTRRRSRGPRKAA